MQDLLGKPGAFFTSLNEAGQKQFEANLVLRRKRYVNVSKYLQGTERILRESKGRVLIVGDRPGPSAPVDPGFHHTPFYSTKHCSGWLNSLQVQEGTPEDQTVWINSTDHRGLPLHAGIVDALEARAIILLGGHARRWFETTNEWQDWRFVEDVPHPQYWKRFRNKDPYPLFTVINELLEIS